jgi:hypothetical protein
MLRLGLRAGALLLTALRLGHVLLAPDPPTDPPDAGYVLTNEDGNTIGTDAGEQLSVAG